MPRIFAFIPVVLITFQSAFSLGSLIDTLIIQPQHPTTADSVSFSINKSIPCNCFQTIFADSIAILASDSIIDLPFKQTVTICDQMVCINPIPKQYQLRFKRGPLAAGTYSVYEVMSIYCPQGVQCPDTSFPSKIGSVTISEPTAVAHRIVNSSKGANQAVRDGRMFNIRGELISRRAIQGGSCGLKVLEGRNHSSATLIVSQP